nr:hypothetical protein [Bacilli bacterium]
MKKFLVLVLSILLILPLAGCSKSDASRFKEEYESLNGEVINGKEIRTLNISKKNPFVYKEAKDIVSMIKAGDTFVVYFGFARCPWCRSILPNLIKAADELDIDKIYYVDVLDIRDTMDIDDKGNPYKKKDADKSYYELLNLLDGVLEDYTLTKNNKKIATGEKRIYAPNIVVVKDGEVINMTTGVSELQTDGYMELTDEMNNESYNKIKNNLNELNGTVCTKEGC